MSDTPVPPTFGGTAFKCPRCGAYAKQTWYEGTGSRGNATRPIPELAISMCEHCSKVTLWIGRTMVFPSDSPAPRPNADLPADIAADFEEARAIVGQSPRGAAALFRLCIQKLCQHLGESGKNLNDDIAALVKKGLNSKVQRALDIVRVIGNEAVHPGTMDLKDNTDTALKLAHLVNIIADAMISQPKLVDELYQELPKGTRGAIDKRDKA